VYITYLSYVYIGMNAIMNYTIIAMIRMNVVDNLNSVQVINKTCV
jgi:hypothetical protein